MTVAVRPRRRTLRAAAALVAVAVLAGCTRGGSVQAPTPASSAPAGTKDPANDPALARFYGQKVVWKGCRNDFDCTKVTVPLDWQKPSGKTIELSLLRLRSTKKKIGTMLLNPGGPGVSAVDWFRSSPGSLGDRVRQSYDAIAWDPRGVGHSTPIRCLADADVDAWLSADSTPDDDVEARRVVADAKDYGSQCLERTGDLIGHVDTVSTVKDMDVIRAAVDERALSYYGWSYGTFIGAWYAELFPWRVGRMVLDGAVDPSIGAQEYAEGQARGFSRMASAFVEDCLGTDGCPLRGTTEQALAQLGTLVEDADAQPLPATGGRELTQNLMTTGMAQALYVPAYWPQLRTALAEAFRGQGDGLLALADAYNGRRPDGTYGQTLQAIGPIFCLDRSDARSLAQVKADAAAWRTKYPPLGDTVAWGSLGCTVWPVKPVLEPQELAATGAPPIVVVGTTGDPATPYEWAQSLAGQLSKGVLVTFEGEGHTAYRRGSKCVDSTVEDYLVSGTVPEADVTCS
ncbi:MAG: alpha/beta hydrolase [Kineosporiaceae bacterium]